MSLQRGFGALAERLGREARGEMGLAQTDRLDPIAMAEHLGIPVFSLAQFEAHAGTCQAISYFRDQAPDRFSAVTVSHGHYRVIVHNDRHAPSRQASNITHELSHAILHHPWNPDLSPRGCVSIDPGIEDEADWMMGVLLVPREGAMALARQGLDVPDIAQHFGVSKQLCRWRISKTGILTQLGRTPRRHPKS